ncbi:hypothetical protein NIES2100_59810 [Calothrix sp. NIES-2100]|uniref:hypothetical protein n=1 Tax=Calothrix sp. NIES-2100 TaxID=1954172 RepID=UPI000B5ECC90|nr:hypothetical protein NIES2100_59810 [Calothrix sp. NIES-2100]
MYTKNEVNGLLVKDIVWSMGDLGVGVNCRVAWCDRQAQGYCMLGNRTLGDAVKSDYRSHIENAPVRSYLLVPCLFSNGRM